MFQIPFRIAVLLTKKGAACPAIFHTFAARISGVTYDISK
jgi:hypothetical protein